jgi:autotransporter translocation and assembly factor TamB
VAAVWPQLSEAQGALVLRGDIGGSVAAPIPDLRAAMEGPDGGATFSLATTGVRYEDVRFELEMDDREIRLRGLSLRTSPAHAARLPKGLGSAEPNVTGDLSVRREGWAPGRKEGAIKLRNALLLGLPERTIRVERGEVGVSGEGRQILLDGDVALSDVNIVADQRFFAGTTDLGLPATFVVHREGVAREEEEEAARDETLLPRWLGFDIAADLQRQGFVQASMPLVEDSADLLMSAATLDVEAQLDGSVRARADDGALSLEGEVRPLRGTAMLFGRAFEVEEGSTVSFTGGGDFTNPVLDLQAVYDAGEYGEISVSITGTPDNLQIDFASDEYPSTDDIFAILLLGTPASEMGSGEEADYVAQVAGMFLSEFETAGKAGTTFDLFQIDTESARLGKRLGPNVFLVMEVDFLADDDDESIYAATIEVRLPASMQLEGSYGTAGESEVGLVWKIRW